MLFVDILSPSINEVKFYRLKLHSRWYTTKGIGGQSERSLHHRLTMYTVPIVLTLEPVMINSELPNGLDHGSMDDLYPS